jgi:hypothetical protein
MSIRKVASLACRAAPGPGRVRSACRGNRRRSGRAVCACPARVRRRGLARGGYRVSRGAGLTVYRTRSLSRPCRRDRAARERLSGRSTRRPDRRSAQRRPAVRPLLLRGHPRSAEPRAVIETGVAHGVSTAFMLAALDANGSGELHSIDLPPHDAAPISVSVRAFRRQLRARWSLHRGMSRSVLPRLLASCRPSTCSCTTASTRTAT